MKTKTVSVSLTKCQKYKIQTVLGLSRYALPVILSERMSSQFCHINHKRIVKCCLLGYFEG